MQWAVLALNGERRDVALLKLTLHIHTHSSSFPEHTVPVFPPLSDWLSCVCPLPVPPRPQEGKAQNALLGLVINRLSG